MTSLGRWRQAVSMTLDQLVDLVQLISGGGLLPATGTTTGSRPLSGYNTTLLQTGDEVFVQGINEVYYYDASSALAADGLNVVNAVGPGQFIRGSTVIAQASWYVDSVNGNDQNAGTVTAPLKTLAELQKRWEAKKTLGATTITLSGATTEALTLQATLGGTLTVSGTPTIIYAGTVGAYQAQAVPNDARLTDAGIGAAGGWSANVQRRLRLTSGAGAGAIAWVLKDLGSNVARVSQFVLMTGAAANPAPGDSYVIETLPVEIGGFQIFMQGGFAVTLQDLSIRPNGTVSSYGSANGGASSGLLLHKLQTLGANSLNIGGGTYMALRGCSNVNQLFIGKNGIQALIGHAAFNTINIQQGGDSRFTGSPCAFQAARLVVSLFGMSDYNVDVAFYDVSTAAPVTIGEGSVFSGAGSGSSQLWGINNTGAFYGVNVNAGGRLTWYNQPTITSGLGNALVGGVIQTWAAITGMTQSSYLNPNNGAVAGLRQV